MKNVAPPRRRPFASLLLALAVVPLVIFLRAAAPPPADAQATREPAAQPAARRDYALVVGVGKYQSGWSPLRDTERDVREVAAALRGLDFDVTLLVDPKRSEMLDALRQFLDDVRRGGGRGVVYLAGYVYVPEPSAESPETYFVLPETPSPGELAGDALGGRSRLGETAVNFRELEKALERLKGAETLLVYDLHSPGQGYPRFAESAGRRFAIKDAASYFVGSQPSPDGAADASPLGIFFARALSGEGDLDGDGRITSAELARAVERRWESAAGSGRTSSGGPTTASWKTFGDQNPGRAFSVNRPPRGAKPPQDIPVWNTNAVGNRNANTSASNTNTASANTNAGVSNTNANTDVPIIIIDDGDPLPVRPHPTPTPRPTPRPRPSPTPPTPPSPEPVKLERYPSMSVQQEVEVGVEFPLEVSLNVELPQEGERAKVEGSDRPTVTVEGPADADEWVIRVNLLATGFKFRRGTSATREFILPREGDSKRAAFYLVPDAIDTERAERTIYASLWHGENYVARISRRVTVVNPARASAGTAADTAGGDAASGRATLSGPPSGGGSGVSRNSPGGPAAAASSPVVVAPPSPKADVALTGAGAPEPLELSHGGPDLTFHYFRADRPGDFNVIVGGRVLQISSHTIRANYRPEDLSAFLKSYYEEFTRAASRDVTPAGGPRAANSRPSGALMRDLGRRLYERFAPNEFKEAFLAVSKRLGPSFKTIQIITDDPTLPWELMVVPNADGGERGFLGAEFNVGRWHDGRGTVRFQPPLRFTHETLVVIAPRYEVGALAGSQDEARALESFYGYTRAPGQKATFDSLAKELPQGIVHFAGHGTVVAAAGAPPNYLIRLEDGDLDLRVWRAGVAPQLARSPLVFFNACSVGQAYAVVNFVDGWAPTFLESGASGYIGALWPVGDRAAAEFSKQFYAELRRQLESGRRAALAEVLKQTRRAFAERGDPTYMAYVFYGSPNLTVMLGNVP